MLCCRGAAAPSLRCPCNSSTLPLFPLCCIQQMPRARKGSQVSEVFGGSRGRHPRMLLELPPPPRRPLTHMLTVGACGLRIQGAALGEAVPCFTQRQL